MTSVRHALTQAWNGQGGWGRVLATALLPLSWAFDLLVTIRRHLYKYGVLQQQHLPVPVIVVGNVMVGGVGKTPITIALTQHLQAQGWHVGVLSRGYGRNTTSSVQAVTPHSTVQDVGDEPLLIARTCRVPVFVGASRTAAGHALLAEHPEVQVLVCDDGLQHWQLARDLELCVFDERGLGNGRLLPAGPLRETWPRQAWADKTQKKTVPCLVLRTSGDTGPNEFAVQRRIADFALRADGTQRKLRDWNNQPLQALAGIAKPEVFFAMLRAQGLTLRYTQALPDHADLQHLHIDTTQGDVLCTEKDAVKLWPQHAKVWAVPLEITLSSELLAAIDLELTTARRTKLSSPNGHHTA